METDTDPDTDKKLWEIYMQRSTGVPRNTQNLGSGNQQLVHTCVSLIMFWGLLDEQYELTN